MPRKCFISFKKEDESYKKYIQNNLSVNMIDKSLDDAIDSDNEDYVMQKIREDYLSDSTVTIHLIGTVSAEHSLWQDQSYIKRELQASLYNGQNNTRNGILGVVLPEMINSVYKGSIICSSCGMTHNLVIIDDRTTVKEFSYNYYIPNNKCFWYEDDRYCVLVPWDNFVTNAEVYIEQAFNKRSHSISNKVKVYP